MLLFVTLVAGLGASAQDATFELTKDVPTAIKLTAEGLASGDAVWTMDEFIQYGNWYGPGWWGGTEGGSKPGVKQPVDALDAIAMKHDFAYQYAEEQGRVHGKEYEYLLKAMADEIAVRDAKRLPKDPNEWDPPASDPATAGRYRDRIQFGFKYWAKKHQLQGDVATVANIFKYLVNRDKLPTIDQAALEAEVAKRAQEWYEREDVRPMYRIELSAPKSLLLETDQVTVTMKLVPANQQSEARSADVWTTPINLTVSGRAELSSYTLTSGGSVVLSAETKWYHLTSGNGKTITVTAGLEDGPFDVLEDTLTFTTAFATNLSLTAAPDTVTEWSEETDEYAAQTVVTFRAQLTDLEGKGVPGIPVTVMDLASKGEVRGVTSSDGVATIPVVFFKSQVGSAASTVLSFSATSAGGADASGTVYTSSTAYTAVTLTNQDVVQVSGTVHSARTGASIGGAAITIDGSKGTEKATTDPNGSFRMTVARMPEPGYEIIGEVTKDGFEAKTFAVGSDGGRASVRLDPLPATVVGRVVDAGTGEGEGGLLDGATVRVTQPFEKLIFTQGGLFTLVDVYIGDTLTMTADAINHKAYTKSGTITMENASITFRLPAGEGDVSGTLEKTAATEEEMDESLPVYHSLMVWASPAAPRSGQAVTATAQVFPPEPGVLVELWMEGTDGYTTSTTSMTNAMGKVFLHIPGAEPGVVDNVVARIIGERVRVSKELRYSFK